MLERSKLNSFIMRTPSIAILLLVNIVFQSPFLLGQDEVSEYELEKLNNKLLVKHQTNNATDTINLIDLIKGKDQKSFFIDINGDTINNESFKEKVVLLDFWFIDCPPCIVELPGLELLQKKINSEKFEVITFAIDDKILLEEKLLSKRKFNIMVIPNIARLKGGYPYKVLVNKNSEIIDYKEGGNKGANSINMLLDRYLPLIKKEI